MNTTVEGLLELRRLQVQSSDPTVLVWPNATQSTIEPTELTRDLIQASAVPQEDASFNEAWYGTRIRKFVDTIKHW